MAVRRRRRRTSNPVRGVGTLVLNPRRRASRRRRRVKARAPARRTNRTRRTNRRRRAISRVSNPRRRRRVRARANPRRRRSYRRRRNRTGSLMIANPRRRRSRRRAAKVIYRYRANPSHRRRVRGRRRSNPSMGGALRRIPVLGGLLSGVAGFVGPALAGVVGVEPTMMLAKLLGGYVPQLNSGLFYGLTGVVLAALVHKFLPVSGAMRKQIATAIAAAAGGVGWYKWRTGMDGPMSGEIGAVPAYGFLGDGGPYAVVPFGEAGMGAGPRAGLGALVFAQ